MTTHADRIRAWAEKVLEEHSEYRIYDDCAEKDCPHEHNVDAGIFNTCEASYMYSLCKHCHTTGGDWPECTEDSPMEQAYPCDARIGALMVLEQSKPGSYYEATLDDLGDLHERMAAHLPEE